jgi:hypothetical protein
MVLRMPMVLRMQIILQVQLMDMVLMCPLQFHFKNV